MFSADGGRTHCELRALTWVRLSYQLQSTRGNGRTSLSSSVIILSEASALGNLCGGFGCLKEESERFEELFYLPGGGRAGQCDLLPDHAPPASGCPAPQPPAAARPGPAHRFLDLSGAIRPHSAAFSAPKTPSTDRTTALKR